MDMSYLVLAAAAAFVGYKLWSMRRSPQQLQVIQQALDSGALLVDVRSPGEFGGGHLPGAQNIPVGSIAGQAATLKKAGKPVVVYCASGTRAGMAVTALKSAGVAEVHNLGTLGAGRGLRFGGESEA